MFEDLLSLFFPHICDACKQPLLKGEKIICTSCIYQFPRTNSHCVPLETLSSKFYGKLNVEAVYSFLYFRKNSPVQQLLHHLKYSNKPEIGHLLGKIYGTELSDYENKFDYIVPVPLHKSRQRSRGYNQSEYFSNGLAEKLQTPVLINNLVRIQKSSTQTKKTRTQRWENVKDIFLVKRPQQIKGLHILLTDDVITTGSTLEACGRILLEAGAKKITIMTIAAAV